MKVLFLPSAGRSGSTLVDRILGQLPGVFGAGELSWVWQKGLVENGRCGCGISFRSCPLWVDVFDRAFGGMDAVDGRSMMAVWHSNRIVSRRLPLLLTRQGREHLPAASPEATAALQALYRAIAAVTGCHVVVDASKNALVPALVSRLGDVEPYVALLVRDPRAVAYSWRRPKRELGYEDDVLMGRNGPVMAAAWWVLTNWATRTASQGLGLPHLSIRYEDLMTDPRASLQRLERFVGEVFDLDRTLIDETAVLGPTHTVWGNPNRFTSGPVELRRDDRWITDMAPNERRIVSALTGPSRSRYGYR